jgi:ABC-type phosphate/phosphonate transport system substrate-binding protein
MTTYRSRLKFLSRLLLAMLLIVLISACRRQTVEALSTALPTFTATPRSTPLPAIATTIPPGQEDNPIQMVLRPAGDVAAARRAISDLEAALLKNTKLSVQIELVEREALAVAALCASTSEKSAMAWISGMAFLAAQAENCGQPLLQIEQGRGSAATTGSASSIVVRTGINSYDALQGRIFCRITYTDPTSWLIPSLMLRSNGLNLISDLKTITDFPSIPELVKAVGSGKCDAAGIPADAMEQFADELQAIQTKVSILETSVDFPYSILMLPTEIPLGTQTALQTALLKLAKDRTIGPKLRLLLGQDALVEVETDSFSALTEFAATTGLDFTQLGH